METGTLVSCDASKGVLIRSLPLCGAAHSNSSDHAFLGATIMCATVHSSHGLRNYAKYVRKPVSHARSVDYGGSRKHRMSYPCGRTLAAGPSGIVGVIVVIVLVLVLMGRL